MFEYTICALDTVQDGLDINLDLFEELLQYLWLVSLVLVRLWRNTYHLIGPVILHK